MELILGGLWMVIQPENIMWLSLGCLIGITFAAVPGINGVTCCVLFIPFTYYLGIIPSLLVLTGMYQGSNFGGVITATLLNIPGDPAAICSTFDGHPMALKGQAGKAIGAGLVASAIGGVLGGICLVTIGPVVAQFAMKMGEPEIFMFVFFGLTTVAAVAGKELLTGFVSLFFGLLISTIGLSPMSGAERFVFGSDYLMGGIEFVVALLGLFALTEVFDRMNTDIENYNSNAFSGTHAVLPSWAELWDNLKINVPRSSLIGTIIGAIPAVGATVAAVLAYGVAKQFSKHPEKFGTGVLEGVMAPESADNASAAGAMMTMLTLGIPGSATTAIILGAFLIAGVQPGPQIFVEHPDIVKVCFGSMLWVNLVMLIMGLYLTRLFVKAMSIPLWALDPLIVALSYLGVFSIRNSFSDVMVMTLFGLIGYTMRRLNIAIGPLVLAMVLGPTAEKCFVMSIRLSDSGLLIFIDSPVSIILLILSLSSLFIPMIRQFREKSKKISVSQGIY